MADDTRGKAYHEKVAQEVIEALQKGTAPWVKPWEPGDMPEGPKNALTGRPYRGSNRVYLTLKQPDDDPRWCTYRQAQQLGAQVREGSQGARIQYWQFHEERMLKDEAGRPVLDDKGQKQFEKVWLERPKGFSAVVFHASQVEGLPPLEKRAEKPEWERHSEAEKLLGASAAEIHHDQGDRAFYNVSKDEIHLPPRDQFPTADRYYATALHEVGHSTGHPDRLNRDLAHPFGSEPYAKEELRAELASYMLGSELGIGHDPGQHHAYIESWIKTLKDDPQELFRASRDAQTICDYVQGRHQERTVEQSAAQAVGPHGTESKTWLAVPYEEKDEAKALGARWDRTEKSWFAPAGTELAPLNRWLPENQPDLREAGRDPVDEFAGTLKAAGLKLDAPPVMDGELHRVAVEGGKSGARDGAYVGHLDGHPSGFFQNYKTGEKANWRASGQRLDPTRVEAVRKETEAKREARKEERVKEQGKNAEALWHAMAKMPEANWDHQYLAGKGVHSGYRTPDIKVDNKGNLVIPISDGEGNTISAQRIGQDGFKSFEKGCRVSGGRYVIGGLPNLEKGNSDTPILIGSGFGTSAVVHEATGRQVVVAFQDSNLKTVALDLHRRFPDRPIAILGDDDRHLQGEGLANSGRVHAAEAAKAVGGAAIFPQFKSDEKGRDFTDFADVARARCEKGNSGINAVNRQVESGLSSFLGRRRQDLGQHQGAPAREPARGQAATREQAKQRPARAKDRGMEHALGL